jgi:hypothetical protein
MHLKAILDVMLPHRVVAIDVTTLEYGFKPDQATVQKLMEDIPISGLRCPLLVHKYPVDYRDRMDISSYWYNKFKCCSDMEREDGTSVVLYGNCRLCAARELGYTSIDCFVFENFEEDTIKKLGKGLASPIKQQGE